MTKPTSIPPPSVSATTLPRKLIAFKKARQPNCRTMPASAPKRAHQTPRNTARLRQASHGEKPMNSEGLNRLPDTLVSTGVTATASIQVHE